MPVERARPMPGSLPVGSTGSVLSNGECPTCGACVLWAQDRLDHSDGARWFAPLDPMALAAPPTPHVWVMVSDSGQASAIAPVLHALHVCPPDAVQEVLSKSGAQGSYTAPVLATPCPVRACYAAPGMLCLTSRRDIAYRPHGARVVVSRGEELEDLTQFE